MAISDCFGPLKEHPVKSIARVDRDGMPGVVDIRSLADEHYSYHHAWRPTDMVIWDNWRMLHCASGNRPEDERLMYRTTIKGDYGLGRFENNRAGGAILSETVV